MAAATTSPRPNPKTKIPIPLGEKMDVMTRCLMQPLSKKIVVGKKPNRSGGR